MLLTPSLFRGGVSFGHGARAAELRLPLEFLLQLLPVFVDYSGLDAGLEEAEVGDLRIAALIAERARESKEATKRERSGEGHGGGGEHCCMWDTKIYNP